MLIIRRQIQVVDVEVECLTDAQPGLSEQVKQQPVAELVAWDRRQNGVDVRPIEPAGRRLGHPHPIQLDQGVRVQQVMFDGPGGESC